MTNFSTLQTLINTCCALLSLSQPSDAAGSPDPNVVLMRTAASLASLEMLNAYEWADLTKRGSITVVASGAPPPPGESTELGFALPEDFFRFIDQTQQPLAIGPVTPQGWMVHATSATSRLTWQVRERQIFFLNPPPAPGQDFKFMYLSQALVRDADNPDLFKNVATKNGDVFVLDGILMALITKVKWLEAKGFDSAAALRDFLLAFDSRVGAQKGAHVLSLVGGRGPSYLGPGNVPEGSIYGMR